MANVKAKVADYPFTTLVPNLGSVSIGDFRFNVIDIPGLIEGASEGKGLGNAFLRHILKARIFAFVADLSRFESWIKETIGLFSEIITYIKQKFSEGEVLTFILREDGNFIILEVKKREELLLSKKIILILNKRDLLNDEAILREYKTTLYAELNAFLRENNFQRLDEEILEKNTFTTSAGTYYGVGEMLRKLAELLQKTPDNGYHPESIFDETTYFEEPETEDLTMVTEITEQEKLGASPLVMQQTTLQPQTPSRPRLPFPQMVKTPNLQNREICKLVFMIPRGNDQAEQYFRQQMQSKGFLEILSSEGVMKGDVLRVKSYYENFDDKYIQY